MITFASFIGISPPLWLWHFFLTIIPCWSRQFFSTNCPLLDFHRCCLSCWTALNFVRNFVLFALVSQFFSLQHLSYEYIRQIFVSLAWVSQILSFQHWCYKNICQNICLSWLIGCHEILSQTLHPALWCHKLLLQILPPPLGCHRVTAIRKVPARAGDRQSPKFAHWAGDGRSSSMGKSLEQVLILGWTCCKEFSVATLGIGLRCCGVTMLLVRDGLPKKK